MCDHQHISTGWTGVFNKSAQLGHGVIQAKPDPDSERARASAEPNTKPTNKAGALRKRARSKTATVEIVRGLMQVPNDCNHHYKSPLFGSYRKTLTCAQLVEVDGGYLVSEYCKQRWCLVCNRIRTAKLIEQYRPIVDGWIDAQTVGLTLQNVTAGKLKDTLDEMNRIFGLCVKAIRRDGYEFKAIRKLECTFNDGSGSNGSLTDWTDTYHPHYHLVIEGEEVANRFVELWLNRCDSHGLTVSATGQDVRPINKNTLNETFKYFTKVLPKQVERADFVALDRIFRCMYRRRVVQPYGFRISKPDEDDEIVTVKTIQTDLNEGDQFEWEQGQTDWYALDDDGKPSGDGLSGYKPGKRFREYLNSLHDTVNRQFADLINDSDKLAELVRDENIVFRREREERYGDDAPDIRKATSENGISSSYWRRIDKRRGVESDLTERFGQFQKWFDRE